MSLIDGNTTIPLQTAGDAGPYAVLVKDWDLGYPDVREVKIDQVAQNGVNDFTQYHGGRVVKLSVLVFDQNGTSKHQTLDLLRAACHPSHRPQLVIQADGWPQQRVLTLRGQPMSCVIGQLAAAYAEATLSWICPSGSMDALSVTTAEVVPAAATTGLSFTPTNTLTGVGISFTPTNTLTGVGLSFTPGSLSNVDTVTNAGTESTPPVITIYGKCASPVVKNRTTGEVFSIPGLTIFDGEYLTIDMANKTVLKNSDSGQSFYGQVDFSLSTWWTVQPGNNDIEFDASNVDNACVAFVSFTSRWV